MTLGRLLGIFLAVFLVGLVGYTAYRLSSGGEIIEDVEENDVELETEVVPEEEQVPEPKIVMPIAPEPMEAAPEMPAEAAKPNDVHLKDLEALEKNIDNLRQEILTLASEHCTDEGNRKYSKVLNCTLDIRGEPAVKDLRQCFEGLDPNDNDVTKCADTVQEKRLQKYCNRDEERVFKDLNSCMAKHDVNALMLKGENETAMKGAQECMKNFDISQVSPGCLGKLTGLAPGA